jgi:molybdenum cofactor cytidylyltransferase
MPQTALILLAAGASTRMGQPKQLLPFRGQPLVRYVVDRAIASICRPIIIVLGANASDIEPLLQNLPVHLVHCEEWQGGMSRSIRSGIRYLSSLSNAVESQIDSVILSVCDQPFVSASLLNQLIQTYRSSQKLLVTAEYDGIWGVPALFDHSLFPELLALHGEGAKPVIQRHRAFGASIAFPEGAIDLDTPEDYYRYISTDVK